MRVGINENDDWDNIPIGHVRAVLFRQAARVNVEERLGYRLRDDALRVEFWNTRRVYEVALTLVDRDRGTVGYGSTLVKAFFQALDLL